MKRFYLLLLFVCFLTSCSQTPTEDTLVYTTSAFQTTETIPILPYEKQTFSFKEEFDIEHDAVKITVESNKKIFLASWYPFEYVENYRYVIVETPMPDGSILKEIATDYMESPLVIYFPISFYKDIQGKTIRVIGEQQKGYDTQSATYTMAFDYESCYSAEPLQMKNEFLHQALTDYFGGEYSERDLLKIEVLYIDYKNFDMNTRIYFPPTITLGYVDAGNYTTKTYHYSDFFEDVTPKPSLMPSELLEDLSYFPSIQSILLRDMDGDEKFEEMEKELLPYEVTENTWDQQREENLKTGSQDQAKLYQVKTELIAAHNAIKVTINLKGKLMVDHIKGEYIENYQYGVIRDTKGNPVDARKYAENEIVLYLPIAYYKNKEDQSIGIKGQTQDGIDIKDTIFLNFDVDAEYSDAPLQMKDAFLHQALTSYFEGEYSERDLLDIDILQISCVSNDGTGAPSYRIYFRNSQKETIGKNYYYSDFFETDIPLAISDELLSDLVYFHALKQISLFENNGERLKILDTWEEKLLPYEVTENTWSD
ncbi:MAG: hypothetical protein IJ489_03670 [Clostridia bacterium]|nr:hypothetical protein [Clostridia bacterium]